MSTKQSAAGAAITTTKTAADERPFSIQLRKPITEDGSKLLRYRDPTAEDETQAKALHPNSTPLQSIFRASRMTGLKPAQIKKLLPVDFKRLTTSIESRVADAIARDVIAQARDQVDTLACALAIVDVADDVSGDDLTGVITLARSVVSAASETQIAAIRQDGDPLAYECALTLIYPSADRKTVSLYAPDIESSIGLEQHKDPDLANAVFYSRCSDLSVSDYTQLAPIDKQRIEAWLRPFVDESVLATD